MTAYNYTTQSWVNGHAGAQLTLTQLQTTLEMAHGPQGDAYARHCGFVTRAALVRHLEHGIADCQTELRRYARNELLARELGVA